MFKEYLVYRNLNNGKFSVKDGVTKLVVGHCDTITLAHATTVVSKRGQQRAMREGVRNVHAYLKGFVVEVGGYVPYKNRSLSLQEILQTRALGCRQYLRYNPFEADTFVDKHTRESLEGIVWGRVELNADKEVIGYSCN